ncbi:hypothetical protein [Vibrio scophthalmi]|uniref:Regulatory protein RecX n=1 Tax=Vibrio scophthalmi LMG 19158 TaxID=870967 RepID=F9RNQ6_9VIBR|nr:hypothetical protein [Vibrio scophthalmi]EGU36852.1 hypothetical protein VIS19158_13912 [Vibrio scophthalmi LMG 19158]
MPIINRSTAQEKSIHELFELLKTDSSNEIREIAIDELLKRGYTLDDISLIAHSDAQ